MPKETETPKVGGAKVPSQEFMEFIRIYPMNSQVWIASLRDGLWAQGKTKEEALYKLVVTNQAWFNLEGMEVMEK